MVLTSKPVSETNTTNVNAWERCESQHCAANLPVIRCPKTGVLYRVTGKLATGFARLCRHHAQVFEAQGFTLEPLSPIELASVPTVGA